MENGQLAKKVEWLDGEHRSAQETIAKLEKRLADLETSLAEEQKKTKPLPQELARLDVKLSKIEEFDKQLRAHKKDLQSEFKQQDAERKRVQKELESVFQAEQKDLERSIQALEKELGRFETFEEGLNARQRDNQLLEEKLSQLSKDVDDLLNGERQRQDLSESLRADSIKNAKLLAEMRGELDAVLKNAEKAIAKVELAVDDQRKLEKQMGSVDEAQGELRDQQRAFMDQAAARRTERERQWKEWAKRFDHIEKTSEEMKVRLQDLGTTDLAVKRAQKAFDELVEKINRRVNELNEIQRLGEQRLRQEWSTFQADSQKRWSNFNLGYDEQRQEADRQRERLAQHVTQIEDTLQEVQDTVQHLGEQFERYFQNMVEIFRETLAENERFFGGFR